MSSKLHKIPHFNTYDDIRTEMQNDLQYRLANRTDKTSFGRPLYYRINVQLILTQECPYNCPFCLERKNPMQGDNDFTAQIEALKKILSEHPNARLTITGGEPGLYPSHISEIIDTYSPRLLIKTAQKTEIIIKSLHSIGLLAACLKIILYLSHLNTLRSALSQM